jgi:hypothetical protein
LKSARGAPTFRRNSELHWIEMKALCLQTACELPRLGYQSAVWAIAHRLCHLVWKILHEGIRFIEQGIKAEPKLLIYRAQSLAKQLSQIRLQRSDHSRQQGASIRLARNTGGGDFRRSRLN